MLNVLDLFSGCGGISLGFKNAGFNIVAGLDKDSSSLITYQENFPNAKIINHDVADKQIQFDLFGLSDVDIIVGGPPCQGFSLSGPRDFEDPRNQLFLFFMDMINKFSPKAILLENVPGFVSLYKGKAKEVLISELSNLGYSVSWQILNSQDFGVPQSRRRVFFIGIKSEKGKFTFPNPSHFDPGTLFGKKQPYITSKDGISDLPSLSESLGKEIQFYEIPPENDYQRLMRNGAEEIHNHIGTNHTERVKRVISLVPDGGNHRDLPPEYRNSRNFNVAWTRFNSKKPSPTIDTGHRHHFHYKWNRVPTVREAARLQSFPDNFIFKGSKTSQYRQVGNAAPPLLVQAIAAKIKEEL